MSFDDNRRSIRLRGYDYNAAGYYHVTICVQDKACLLGEVKGGETVLSDWGRQVDDVLRTPAPGVHITDYVIMPNHVYMLLEIEGGATSLGKCVGQLKVRIGKALGAFIWQRNYFEHIVRDKEDYENIRNYIFENPQRWEANGS